MRLLFDELVTDELLDFTLDEELTTELELDFTLEDEELMGELLTTELELDFTLEDDMLITELELDFTLELAIDDTDEHPATTPKGAGCVAQVEAAIQLLPFS